MALAFACMTIPKTLLAHARAVLESRGLFVVSRPEALVWRDAWEELRTLTLTRYSTRFGDVLRVNFNVHSVPVSKKIAKELKLIDGFLGRLPFFAEEARPYRKNRSEVTVLFSEGEAALDWVLSVPDGHTRPAPFALHRVHRSWGYVWSERAWEATEPPTPLQVEA